MNIKKVLSRENVLVDLKSDNKNGIIEELLDHLVSINQIKSEYRDVVLEALMDREGKMSTGMQYGVAIPHCKTAVVDHLVAVLAVKQEGVDFNSLDGEPSRIFVMTVSPINRTGPHIQFLAEVSRLFKEKDIQERMLNATTTADILALL